MRKQVTRMDWQAIALVSVGSVAGALLRFGASTWIPTRDFPWATLLVNLGGAFLIGLVMLPQPAEHATRLWFVVGFLGALTTLSTYSFETIDLWRTGRAGMAFANVVANGIGGPLMVVIAWRLKILVA